MPEDRNYVTQQEFNKHLFGDISGIVYSTVPAGATSGTVIMVITLGDYSGTISWASL